MNDNGIRINWRAAILPIDGKLPIIGQLCRLSQSRAVVRVDHNLIPRSRCNLAILLPKNTQNEESQIIEGRGVVYTSVLSSMQFHITFELLNIIDDGKELLNTYIENHKSAWKIS